MQARKERLTVVERRSAKDRGGSYALRLRAACVGAGVLLVCTAAWAQGRPTLTMYSPTQGAQGSTVTLTFTGANFTPRLLQLHISPSQGMTVVSVAAKSPTQVVAQVQIASTAATGTYKLDLMDADHDLAAPTPFTVTAAQTPGCASTALAAVNCGPVQPAIKEMSPLSGHQGTTVLLTLNGANFVANAALQMTPSTGLTLGKPVLVNANELQTQVTIAPNAPLGPRGVTLLSGNYHSPAPNTFTVTPAGNPGQSGPPMQILRLVPSQITAGAENVDVAIEGTNFVPGTLVTFSVGAGIPAAVTALGPARYVNSTELHVTVSTLSTALPGGRDIALQGPEQQRATGPRMLNVVASVVTQGPPPSLKITPINLQPFTMGKIVLDTPQWGDVWEGEIEEHYGVPVLDDDAKFQWHEQNPGLADYYVLNIYLKDGTTLLASKRIDGVNVLAMGGTLHTVPTYYRPDAAFLAAALEPSKYKLATHTPFTYTSHATPTYTVVNGVKIFQPPAQSSSSPQLSVGDLQWEVVGYHTYNTNSTAPQAASATAKAGQSAVAFQANSALQNKQAAPTSPPQTTDIEVEVSERWPLDRPAAPTGMACSGGGMGNGLNTQDADATGSDPNFYAGDRFVISGSFNLTDSPYATHPNLIETPGSQCSGCLFGQYGHVAFDNVFVDWGDGSIQKLTAEPSDPNITNWNRSEGLVLSAINVKDPDAVKHAYGNQGSFKIRVFQLSEADAQHVNASLLAASVDGPGTSPFLQAATLNRISLSGGGGGAQNSIGNAFQAVIAQSARPVASGGGGPDVSAITSRAYMFYCYALTITVPEDLAADGPLHLISIADPDFPGHDNTKPKVPIHLMPRPGLSGSSGSQSKTPVVDVSNTARLGGAQPTSSSAQAPKVSLMPTRPGSVAADATCSTCDDAAIAQSQIKYYGRGPVMVTWNVDGTTEQEPMSLPSSPRRNLTGRLKPGEKLPDIIDGYSKVFPTPDPLNTKTLGMHAVSVVADIAPDPAQPNLPLGVRETLGKIAGNSSGSLDAAAANSAKSLLNSLSPPAGSNLPPLKVGVLSSTNQSAAGLGAVQYVNPSLEKILPIVTGIVALDSHVASEVRHYEVVQSDPTKPCKFLFPVTSGGSFEIGDIQGHVTQQGTKYSGSGNLIVRLANETSQSYDIFAPIPVSFTDWEIPDGSTVTNGSFDVSPNAALPPNVPGLSGTIDRIQGHTASTGGAVQGEVDATLSVALSDPTLRLPGVETPPQWTGVTAELHSNGDWIKDGLTMPRTIIGWSQFQMQSPQVRLDLSHSDGDNAGPLCAGLSGNGKDWVGVRFPQLTVIPYTLGLVSGTPLEFNPTDWAVVDGGLCGSVQTTKPFKAQLDNGTVSFQSISATATPGHGDFDAYYNGVDIYVPWLDTHITGSGKLITGGGQQAAITFQTNPQPVTKTYGNISFKASNLLFTQVQNIGWAVQSSTTFTFSTEGKKFAIVPLTPFTFGMDGRGYLGNGGTAQDVSLMGSSTLGSTPVDLQSVHITVPMSGSEVMGAQFATTVHLSEVMPAVPMQVNYEMDEAGTNITAQGPTNSPFTVDVPYPSGSPTSDAKIHPVYGGQTGTEYNGTVDLSELGGPPVTAQFRLGYANGHDYWLARAIIGLGDTGIPIVPVPPVMNLYSISGGMGHNFPLTAFTDTGDLKAASPVFDNSFLFMAGMRVGMPDHFTYTIDGDLTIKATGQNAGARMDFHAWLLKPPDNGNGDFQGYFQYAGGNFDGRLWGQLSFMNGLASLSLGNSANNAAVDMHFGNGPWHIDAGKKEGPRIDGHFLVSDAQMYMDLSDQGLSLGGGVSIDLDVGDDSVASAYVRGSVDAGVTITPQPHISGDFSANASAGACVASACVSGSVSAQIHAEALPLEMNASASLGLPWPLGSVSFSVHL